MENKMGANLFIIRIAYCTLSFVFLLSLQRFDYTRLPSSPLHFSQEARSAQRGIKKRREKSGRRIRTPRVRTE